jgi:hypothetical protein
MSCENVCSPQLIYWENFGLTVSTSPILLILTGMVAVVAMIFVEIYARDELVFLYYRNIYVFNYGEPLVKKSVDFCKNGEIFNCIIANNSSTILGIIVSIAQAVTQAIIAVLVSKANFADKGKQELVNYSLGFGIGYLNAILIPMLNGFYHDHQALGETFS